MSCPCGSNLTYPECCGRFIDTSQVAKTPEELMRSRYTAYTQANMDYIIKTMKPPAANEFEPISSREWAEKSEWVKLEIVKTKTEGDKGWVEFVAIFNIDKKQHALHELSEFRRDEGTWYYVDGVSPEEKTQPIKVKHIGRNDPCACGSGKKYKKCCGA